MVSIPPLCLILMEYFEGFIVSVRYLLLLFGKYTLSYLRILLCFITFTFPVSSVVTSLFKICFFGVNLYFPKNLTNFSRVGCHSVVCNTVF